AAAVPSLLTVVPDMDGDALSDVVTFAQGTDSCLVEARRGIDGVPLWQVTLPTPIHPSVNGCIKLVPRVTATGRGGVFVDIRKAYVAISETGAVSYVLAGNSDDPQGWPARVLLDAIPGPATDVVYRAPTQAGKVVLTVFDGATGLPRNATVVDAHGVSGLAGEVDISPAGDLDSDGLEDFIVHRTATSTTDTFAAYAGVSANRLWAFTITRTTSLLGAGRATMLGDVTGDGVADFSYSPEARRQFELRSGATGALVWSRGAGSTYPFAVGDINSDGVDDLVLADRHPTPLSVVGVDGPTGAVIYATALTPGGVGPRFSLVGDVDADGVGDLHLDTKGTDDFISGATGAVLRSGSKRVPVFGSLDGSGDDLISSEWVAGITTVRGHDGATDAILWERALSTNVSPMNAARLDGDAAPEVITSVFDQAPFNVLRGSDGAVLWTLS
ncbi:MAG TPA: hypothetical protein VNB24_00865, partial [Acidimicrobiales bacterium]|nr:hypothetical protein [Acidimicrobiales bacterium]